jgi:hypothetical protein
MSQTVSVQKENSASTFVPPKTSLAPQRSPQADSTQTFVPRDSGLQMSTDWSVQASPEEGLTMEDIDKQLASSSSGFMDKLVSDAEEPPNTESVGVQPKLAIGQVGDPYEVEADQVADKVMRMPEPVEEQSRKNQGEVVQRQPVALSISRLVQRQQIQAQAAEQKWAEAYGMGQEQINLAVQRKCSKCQEEEEQEKGIQRKEIAPESGMLQAKANSSLESRLAANAGGGSALPDDVRSFMEPRFGADFSSVRVHTDGEAVQMNKALGAQAFAHGSDLYFRAGEYNPGSSDGKRLLAHELTHVVQQTGGVQAKHTFERSEDQSEHQADEIAKQAMGTPTPAKPQSIQLRGEEKESPITDSMGQSSSNLYLPQTAPSLVADKTSELIANNANDIPEGYEEVYQVRQTRPGYIELLDSRGTPWINKNGEKEWPVDTEWFSSDDIPDTIWRADGAKVTFALPTRYRLHPGDRVLIPKRPAATVNYESPYVERTTEDKSTDGTFAIKSDASSTVKIGTVVTYSVEQLRETIIAAGSTYRYQWSVEIEPTQANRRTIPYPVPRRNSSRMVLTTRYGGEHRVKVKVLLDNSLVSTLEFKQLVNEDGRSPLHKRVIDMANQTQADQNVIEWNNRHGLSYGPNVMQGRPNDPISGLPNNMNIWGFKNQWVRGYVEVIKMAANEFDIPRILLAGIAFMEVGGDPPIFDSAVYNGRAIFPGLGGQPSADNTSFGNLSLQVRRGAEALGYDPNKLAGDQRTMIIESLKDARQNLFIAAKHLSDLREIDFPGKKANELTRDDMMVIAGRYNRGPDRLPPEEQRKYTRGYGLQVIKYIEENHLEQLFQ